eukprot:gnl/TRDRNA2_/TRDRNA2_89870_c0_seq1.p1 gnl/TRDRNA2_/TRDRNA2_89870_c0~~gnl/TRDRNA2_/TRDRNA2_89870_c0_seq1.p1  ORF type:complete len:330 (+),score=41.08 gnl/TRDRNA2_/TRDRNA2_89870_c0_seq1:75-1064(+)
MYEQMQPTYLDVVARTLNQPVCSTIDPDLPVRCLSQRDRRWALIVTATALLFVAVAVLGFWDTTVPKSLTIEPTTLFTKASLAPALSPAIHSLRPLIVCAHRIKSKPNPVYARKPFLCMSCVGDGPASDKDRTELAKQDSRNVPAEEAVTMFAVMDLDGNGVVSEEEFRTYLSGFSYTPDAATKIFKALDANGDGVLSQGEVRELAKYVDGNSQTALGASMRFGDAQFFKVVHAQADRMFNIIDENGDGEISPKELRNYLMGNGYSEIASEAVLRSLDSNADGKLSPLEFRNGFEKYSALKQAVVELVKHLVESKRWMPADYYRTDARP